MATTAHLLLVGMSLALGGAGAPAAFAARYQVVDLGVEPAINDGGWDVTNDGLVAGTAWFGASDHKAFAYQDGRGWFLGDDLIVTGVNAGGQIIANRYAGRCYLYVGGTWSPLPLCNVYDISDSGLLFGTNYVDGGWHAAVYDPARGDMTDIGVLPGCGTSNAGGINNLGEAVGWCASTAYLYAGGEMINLGPGYAQEINDRGEVIGTDDTTSDGFVYRDGQFTRLAPFGAPKVGRAACQPYDINDHGVAVGAATWAGSANYWDRHAFLYCNGVMTDLNELIPDDCGWELYYAYGINDRNWIVGYGRSPQGLPRAFLLVPEPASLVLTCGAAAGVLLGRRRRNRAASGRARTSGGYPMSAAV